MQQDGDDRAQELEGKQREMKNLWGGRNGKLNTAVRTWICKKKYRNTRHGSTNKSSAKRREKRKTECLANAKQLSPQINKMSSLKHSGAGVSCERAAVHDSITNEQSLGQGVADDFLEKHKND